MITERSDSKIEFIDFSSTGSSAFETVEGAPGYMEAGPISHILLDKTDGDKITFSKPSLSELFNYWSEQSGNGELPPSSSFDPISVRKAMGYINVIEPVNGGSDFLYRLVGTHVSDGFRTGFSGKLMSEFPSRFKESALWQTKLVYERRKALYSEHVAPANVSAYLQWSRLLTPWVDANGKIDRIISCNVPSRHKEAAP